MPAELPAYSAAAPHAQPHDIAKRNDGDTTQISLRLPESWMTKLRRRAANASTAEDRMVSPQEVVRRILRRELEREE